MEYGYVVKLENGMYLSYQDYLQKDCYGVELLRESTIASKEGIEFILRKIQYSHGNRGIFLWNKDCYTRIDKIIKIRLEEVEEIL